MGCFQDESHRGDVYAALTMNCAGLLGRAGALSDAERRYIPNGVFVINAMIVGLGKNSPGEGSLEISASSDDPDFLLGIGMRALQSNDSTKVYEPLMELRRTLVDLINEEEVPHERRDAAAHFFAEAHRHITGYPS